MKLVCNGILLAALTCVLGCGGEFPPEPPATSMAAPPPTPAPPGDGSGAGAPATEAAAEEPSAAVPVDSAATEDMPADGTAVPAAAAAPGSTDEVAQVGVGVKGKDYGGPGFVTTPIEAYFRTGERIAFEVQIPNAMKLYKADHNNKGPKTHEEFMNIIIKENGVQLPDLAEGEEFVYDPASEQLLVRHPAK